MVIIAAAPALRAPRSQPTPDGVVTGVPRDEVAKRVVAPGDTRLVKTTMLAVVGPALVTVKVLVKLLPKTGPAEATTLTPTSANWFTGETIETDNRQPPIILPVSPPEWSATNNDQVPLGLA